MADTGHWMPFYWADYFANTNHFTTEEHGAYVLLIGTYWRRGCALPADHKFLAACARLPVRRSKLVMDKLSEKFVIFDGLWYHVRVEIELLRSSERLASARANGRAGGIASGVAKANLLTITPTEESRKIVNFNFGKGRKGVEMTDENKLSIFHNWLAPLLGNDGWVIIQRAMDPSSPDYSSAMDVCRKTARTNGKGWPHQWPK